MSDEVLGSTIFALPQDWDDIKEDQPVDPQYYPVVIDKAELKLSKEKRNPMIELKIKVEGTEETTPLIWMYITLPYAGCHKFILQNLKRFIQAFEIPAAPGGNIDVNSIRGLRATLFVDKVKNDKGKWVNEIKLPEIAG